MKSGLAKWVCSPRPQRAALFTRRWCPLPVFARSVHGPGTPRAMDVRLTARRRHRSRANLHWPAPIASRGRIGDCNTQFAANGVRARRVYEVLEDGVEYQSYSDCFTIPPEGLFGGENGGAAFTCVLAGQREEHARLGDELRAGEGRLLGDEHRRRRRVRRFASAIAGTNRIRPGKRRPGQCCRTRHAKPSCAFFLLAHAWMMRSATMAMRAMARPATRPWPALALPRAM